MSATSRVDAETATTGPAQRRAWLRALLLFAAATALLFGLMHQTVATLVRTWTTSDTFGYGFLILPSCCSCCTSGAATLPRSRRSRASGRWHGSQEPYW
ncbi:MAG: hypothetical protein RLN99_19215 [Kiloniellaceae bacterium]